MNATGDDPPVPPVRRAGVVLPVTDLTPTLDFFTDLGFALVAIAPADQPTRATLAGFGLCVHLDPDAAGDPGTIRLSCDGPPVGEPVRVAPNGTRVELHDESDAVPVPRAEVAFAVSRAADATWTDGRAGMRYRDLVPGRLGGALVASLIHVADGGPVPDWVHYHRVAFQLIYCAAGWVEVVYEDQGAPFVLEQGDAVLQPPGIRHLVREASDELVVVELTIPADHDTLSDAALELPTETFRPSRRFGGQRFVRHIAGRAIWVPWNGEARLEGQRLRIDVPTNHLASAWTVRSTADGAETEVPARRATSVLVVLDGAASIECEGEPPVEVTVGDAVTIPPERTYRLQAEPDFEMLAATVELPT